VQGSPGTNSLDLNLNLKVPEKFCPVLCLFAINCYHIRAEKKIMDAKTISLTQAQTYLATLAVPLKAGEEIVIVRDNTPLAKLVAPTQPLAKIRTFGRYTESTAD